MKETARKIVSVLGSRQFFYGVCLFFVLESLWIAVSAAYPMAFDEEFHMGVIRVYAGQWSPFLADQPAQANQFGALTTDPSYLFHYLMSFPYRFIRVFTANEMATIILLRLLNIAMAAWAVWLFRRVLVRAGMSAAFTHTALALFVLVPMVPMVAGQVNYDNLMLLLVAAMFLLAFAVFTSLRRRHFPLKQLIFLAAVCMAGSLVKYPFLPFAAAAAVFVLSVAYLAFRGRYALLWYEVRHSYRILTAAGKAGLVLLAVVSFGLFLQRYGVNLVRYHTPVPSCHQALSVHECVAYGPWARNYGLAAVKGTFDASPVTYAWQWLQSLHYRMFFAVNGPSDSYRNYPPLPVPSAAAVLVAVSGVAALGLYGWRTLRGRPLLLLLLGTSLLYVAVLWADGYSQYLETGRPVAINGRYLLPVLLPLGAVFAAAMRPAFTAAPHAKAFAAGAVILLFLHGGGVFTFIARSDPAWYWPNGLVRSMNEGAEQLLLPVIFEGSKYYH